MRPLRPDEIEVRIGQIYSGGCSMLLYKNARVDMAVLDELYGPTGWQRDHKEVKGNMYCGIGIWDDEKACWVWKWDAGTESNTEKEKGEASDSFKRAGTNWGIGRELYTSPFIWLEVATNSYQMNGRTYYKLNDAKELRGIVVSHIKTEDINGVLTITELDLTQKGHTVYHYERKEK